jgi:hypothetical protein
MSDWDPQPWETDGGLPWEAGESDDDSSGTDLWRGSLHLADWPENLAGPEYWLYKAQDERDAA